MPQPTPQTVPHAIGHVRFRNEERLNVQLPRSPSELNFLSPRKRLVKPAQTRPSHPTHTEVPTERVTPRIPCNWQSVGGVLGSQIPDRVENGDKDHRRTALAEARPPEPRPRKCSPRRPRRRTTAEGTGQLARRCCAPLTALAARGVHHSQVEGARPLPGHHVPEASVDPLSATITSNGVSHSWPRALPAVRQESRPALYVGNHHRAGHRHGSRLERRGRGCPAPQRRSLTRVTAVTLTRRLAELRPGLRWRAGQRGHPPPLRPCVRQHR